MLGVPREVLQRYLYGAAVPEVAPAEDVLPQDIADDDLAAAMAEPPPSDPMADLRRRYLEAQREGEGRDAANAIASQLSTISSNMARNLGLSSSPIIQRQHGLQDAPTRALERQLAQERALAPPAVGRAAAPTRPVASNDPTSPESRRYQEAFRAQYPEAPEQLIGAITGANYDSFRKTLEAGAGIKARGAALASQEEREKTRLLQQQEQGQLNRAVQWARLRQEAEESGKSREFRRWLFEQEEDAKEKERTSKAEKEQRALNVPDADIAPGATPTPQDAEAVKKVLTAEKGMKNGIARMRDLHKQYGTEKGGKGAMLLNQAMKGIQLEAKDIAGLGALSGPDQGLMESLGGDDPTTAWTNVKGFFGVDNTEAALQGLEAWMNGKVRATLEARGYKMRTTSQRPAPQAGAPQPAAPPPVTPARETKKYSAKQDMTYVFDAAGKPIRTERGDTRGRN